MRYEFQDGDDTTAIPPISLFQPSSTIRQANRQVIFKHILAEGVTSKVVRSELVRLMVPVS